MELAFLAVAFIIFVTVGYFTYGSFVSRMLFNVDPKNVTPAHEHADGQEFLAARPFYLFCQHFSAIAASGPIAGPILACQVWGFVPCLLWISLGVVFIGAIHDFSALTASVRHHGTSIVHVCQERLGPKAGRFLLLFIWLALIYVIVAFTQVTAATFTHASEELEGIKTTFSPGGAVLASSLFYLVLCLIMGVVQKLLRPPLWLVSILFIPAIAGTIWLGMAFSNHFLLSTFQSEMAILGYCAIASLTPVWLLLQPRGFLGGIVLIVVMGVGIYGILFGNFTIEQPAFAPPNPDAPSLLPFLFVTIACGACSGFHGLVCGGTTSKQIDNEKHLQPIGYGAMLMEGIVAFIALSTIMIFTSEAILGMKPGTIYGKGIGEYLALIIGPEHLRLATTFGAVAFSTFVFDTLDVATRLGRYLIQEFFGFKNEEKKWLATALTLSLPALIIYVAPADSWMAFWTLFGSANQLLAALTLLVITVWLRQSKRPIIYTLLPMLFVLAITLWSLVSTIIKILSADTITVANMITGTASFFMIALALYIVVTGIFAVPSAANLQKPVDIG